MRTKASISTLAAMWALAGAAEEQPLPILTNSSATTISGYVDASAHWNVHSSPVRFEDLCRVLRERGLRIKRFGDLYFFFRSGKPVLYLSRRGPFASRSHILQVRRYLGRL